MLVGTPGTSLFATPDDVGIRLRTGRGNVDVCGLPTDIVVLIAWRRRSSRATSVPKLGINRTVRTALIALSLPAMHAVHPLPHGPSPAASRLHPGACSHL